MVAYGNTEVSSYKSQDAIRKILLANGVKGVQFSENFETREIIVKFAKEVQGNLRTVKVSMTIPEPPQPKRRRASAGRYSYREHKIIYNKTPAEKQEQMARATYRALHYWLKSQFEAVAFGLMSFEDVFLSHFEWMVDGRPGTVGELIRPYLERPQLEAPKFSDDVIDADVSSE